MSKLLRADLLRLKKDRTFWCCMIAAIVYAVFMCMTAYHNSVKYDADLSMDDCLMKIYLFSGIFAAVFCSLHIGTEYSDGTMRNKLVVGRTRTAIYLSNAIIAIGVNILFSIVYMAVVCILGIPLLGPAAVALPELVILLAVGTLMIMATTSVCCLLSMLNHNKALVAVISIIGAFALIMLAALITSSLNAPEFYEDVVFLDKAGKPVLDSIANPQYVRGTKRAVYQFIADFLPTGQALGLSTMVAENPWWMMGYSLIITAVSNVVGILAFRRKDLQ